MVAGFALSILRLLLNPVFLLLVLSSCFFGFAMNGTYIFLPKYLQHQFDIPAWKGNFIMGRRTRTDKVVVVVVVAAATVVVGTVVVGVVASTTIKHYYYYYYLMFT